MFHNSSPETLDRTPAPEIDDATLVRRFNAGDDSAFEAIVKGHYARVLALVRRSMNNNQDAEDIAQITFIRAHRGLASFRGDSALSTWLSRIALNLARNRYWYFFRRRHQDSVSLDQPHSIAHLVPSAESTPAQHAIQSEFVDLAARCLEQLDPPQRDILRMRYHQQYSYGEIARELNINFGTVKSRVARAREKLRARILATAPDFGSKASLGSFFEPLRRPPSVVSPVG